MINSNKLTLPNIYDFENIKLFQSSSHSGYGVHALKLSKLAPFIVYEFQMCISCVYVNMQLKKSGGQALIT